MQKTIGARVFRSSGVAGAALAVLVVAGCPTVPPDGTNGNTHCDEALGFAISLGPAGHIHGWREATLTFTVSEEEHEEAAKRTATSSLRQMLRVFSPSAAYANGAHDADVLSGLDFHVSYQHEDADEPRDASVGPIC